ncbi:MAG TPA: heme-binding domain-containing protein [Anaerolineales bacterium]|nr:heme-binding domain-containing protein [Anaerolineales bacterium]
MKKKVILWGLGVIVVLALLIQLVPLPGRGQNPPVVQEPKWDSPQTAALVKRACYDCHSNQTVWPWYSYVAPVSWLVYHDVMEGRSRLNFSEWNRPQLGAGELAEIIQEGEMPPFQYLPMHPSARLSATEKQQLIDGIKASLP